MVPRPDRLADTAGWFLLWSRPIGPWRASLRGRFRRFRAGNPLLDGLFSKILRNLPERVAMPTRVG
jgi:hypothetical protein